jgi:HSP20 family protein
MRDLDWRVIRELAELRTRFREVLERAMLPCPPAVMTSSGAFEPVADVWETEDEVVVAVELPGAVSESVAVRLEGSTLFVSGEMPAATEASGRFLRVERPRGPFHRAIPLPAGVNGKPRAFLSGGVLQVTLPRSRPLRRRVPIGVGSS